MMILPTKDKDGKPYLSYSQVSSWLKDRKEYMRSYFLGERFGGNAYTEFGGMIGKALELNDFSAFTPKEQETLKTIVRLDEFEREIKWDFGTFYLKGFIDTNTKDISHLADYKTGSLNKVDEYKKEEYIQPIIYAAALHQETGIMPTKAEVIFIERMGNAFKGEQLVLGEQVIHIPIDITEERIAYAKDLVLNTAKQIEDYYKVFLKLNS